MCGDFARLPEVSLFSYVGTLVWVIVLRKEFLNSWGLRECGFREWLFGEVLVVSLLSIGFKL